MGDEVITIYTLTDDFLRDLGHREPPEREVSDAEVLTVALVAARFFGGNFSATRRAEAAWRFLTEYAYMPRRLSRSQCTAASTAPSR